MLLIEAFFSRIQNSPRTFGGLFQSAISLVPQNTSGEYMEAMPIEGTVLVDIGDILQFWTSGKLKSTKHKIDVPTDLVKHKSARLSIACFVSPNNDVRIDRQLPCVGDQEQLADAVVDIG